MSMGVSEDVSITSRQPGDYLKIAVILSGAPQGRRRSGAESKDPVNSEKVFKQDRTLFRHFTGSFTVHRPAAFARADASFRMTPLFFDAYPARRNFTFEAK